MELVKKIICLLGLISIIATINYAIVSLWADLGELKDLNAIDQLKYCMENVGDEKWLAYNSNLKLEQDRLSGVRTIQYDNFCISLQTQPMPDAFMTSIPPDEDEIPYVEYLYNLNLSLCRHYKQQETIQAILNYSDWSIWNQWDIEWDSEINAYKPNTNIEEYTGLSVNDIAEIFDRNDWYLEALIEKLMVDVIAEQKHYCVKFTKVVAVMDFFFLAVLILYVYYRRWELRHPED